MRSATTASTTSWPSIWPRLVVRRGPPPNPLDAILMGDFNTEPDRPEYKEVVGSTPGVTSLVDSYLRNSEDKSELI